MIKHKPHGTSISTKGTTVRIPVGKNHPAKAGNYPGKKGGTTSEHPC